MFSSSPRSPALAGRSLWSGGASLVVGPGRGCRSAAGDVAPGLLDAAQDGAVDDLVLHLHADAAHHARVEDDLQRHGLAVVRLERASQAGGLVVGGGGGPRTPN